jgi:hypothetical protein
MDQQTNELNRRALWINEKQLGDGSGPLLPLVGIVFIKKRSTSRLRRCLEVEFSQAAKRLCNC